MKKIISSLCLLAFNLLFLTSIYAVGTQTVNGIPTYDVDFGMIKGVRAEYFSSYVATTTEVYNEEGSTTATSGQINVSPYTLKSMGFRVSDKSFSDGAGTVTFTIRQFIGTSTYADGTVTVTLNRAQSYALSLVEQCQYVNVSVVTSTGTATVNANGLSLPEKGY